MASRVSGHFSGLVQSRSVAGTARLQYARLNGMRVAIRSALERRRQQIELHTFRRQGPASPSSGQRVAAMRERIRDEQKSPLFRLANRRTGILTENRMHRVDAWRMVQRRAPAAGLIVQVGNHSFRATGIAA